MSPLPSNSTPKPLRWGILSTARIIRRNWCGMRDSGAASLVALASRDLGKARSFIAEMQEIAPWTEAPAAHGSYESLLASPEVDAVYIPLPTGIRKEWVLRAAEAGKHILCEKPCAISSTDLREMIASCQANCVLFMDGVMFMHDPRFSRLREILDDGASIGPVKRISSAFSFRGGDDFTTADIRSRVALEPTGCLGDLGWYCLRASLWAMHWQLPTRVSGRILATSTDAEGHSAITEFSGELDFPGGASSSFYCSFHSPNQKWLNISGTKGSFRVADFIAPAADNDTDWEIGFDRAARPGETGITNDARMFATFAAAANDVAERAAWAEISLKTQLVQDACETSSRLGKPLFLHGEHYAPHRER